jgi:hypothetical protein
VRAIQVLIVDDHQLVADGLGMLLDGEPDREVCATGAQWPVHHHEVQIRVVDQADGLGINYAAVRSHIRSFDTAHSKIEAVAAAREMNIIE